MKLEVFASRAFNGRVRTRKLYASETHPDDGDGMAMSLLLLSQQRPAAASHDRYVTEYFRHDHTWHQPVVHLELFHRRRRAARRVVQFLLDNDYDLWGMTAKQLLEYLEHGVDWE